MTKGSRRGIAIINKNNSVHFALFSLFHEIHSLFILLFYLFQSLFEQAPSSQTLSKSREARNSPDVTHVNPGSSGRRPANI